MAWAFATSALEWRVRRLGSEPCEPEPALDREPALRIPEAGWRVPLLVSLAASLAAVYVFTQTIVPRRIGFAFCVASGAANLALALGCLRAGAVQIEPEAVVAARAGLARWTRALALALGLGALASSLVFVREDKDDTLYLSEALVLADAAEMARFAPTERGDELPATEVYDWQAFELWAAQLALLSGIHPMVEMRTLFAPLVAALAFLFWLELLRRLLPRWAVPVAMLVVLAYFVIGTSSHWAANNFLLPRPQQGKTWLIHVFVPALVLLTGEAMTRLSRGSWILLLLAALGAFGCAPTAIFLVPGLLAPLALAWFAAEPSRERFRNALAIGGVTLPGLAFGVWLALSQDEVVRRLALDFGAVSMHWRDYLLARHLNTNDGGGAIELFALVSAPLSLLLLPERRQWAWPLSFTVLYFATTANPLLCGFLERNLLGPAGYDRLFWLVPFPVLLALPIVAVVAVATRARAVTATGLVALTASLAALPLVGGHFVFGARNVYFDRTFLPPPYVARNAYKIPQPLFDIALELERRATGPTARILCSERSASHLAPFAPAFSFVYSRTWQTGTALVMAGRGDESVGRQRLAREFLRGEMSRDEAAALLESSRTAFVVLDAAQADVEDTLAAEGFQPAVRSGSYSLWERAR